MMTGYSPVAAPASRRLRADSAALLLLALTSVHHAYGAAVYGTPWRLHILLLAVPAALVIAAALRPSAGWTGYRGRAAMWLGAAVILIVPVLLIGFFEGGYNHVLKNIVYFGFGEAAARGMFPPPTYEMPNDFLFELTGVAQFPLSVVTAFLTLRMLRLARG